MAVPLEPDRTRQLRWPSPPPQLATPSFLAVERNVRNSSSGKQPAADLSYAERTAAEAEAEAEAAPSSPLHPPPTARPGDPRSKRRTRATDEGVGRDSKSPHLARRRSQYFEDAFSVRDDGSHPAQERVRSEAPILVEVRTNVIVGDEFTLITELSAHLALRYRRPLSSVVVTLQHNSCMCFGGSFEPAYAMVVFALPAELQPTTNKRNAALIQKHMEEALGVAPARGLLRFAPVPDPNLAYAGTTAAGHADELQRATVDSAVVAGASRGVRSPTSEARHKISHKLSVKSLSRLRALPIITVDEYSEPPRQPSPPLLRPQAPSSSSPLLAIPERVRSLKSEKGPEEAVVVKAKARAAGASSTPMIDRQPSRRARRSKSFVSALFSRPVGKEAQES